MKALPKNVPWLVAPDTAMKLLSGRFAKTEVMAEMKEQSGKGFKLVGLYGRK